MTIYDASYVYTYDLFISKMPNTYIRIRHDSFVSYERNLIHILLCMMPHTYIRRMRTYLIRVWLYMPHKLYGTWRLHRTYASLVYHEQEFRIRVWGMAYSYETHLIRTRHDYFVCNAFSEICMCISWRRYNRPYENLEAVVFGDMTHCI